VCRRTADRRLVKRMAISKLKKAIAVETTFGTYRLEVFLGEGGAGRVYGGVADDGSEVAVKILAADRASREKRGRFKNEIAFLARNRHKNIVTVIDHGVSQGEIEGPFYVMSRYDSNLRGLMQEGIPPGGVLPLFSQVLDGVEAAHLQGVVHRDLKPENILFDRRSATLAIADFGIASFTEDIVATLVETSPRERLANFQYAAPEQRAQGRPVTSLADIYALGLMLNEMFTGEVPYGTEYKLIAKVSKELGFLDAIVGRMLRQAPDERPATVGELKGLLERHQAEAASLQRLSRIDGTVISAAQIDEPLAQQPPRLIGADWKGGRLTLTLDRPVTGEWVAALQRMGSYTSVMGKDPSAFSFRGNQASVDAAEHQVQAVIDHFKTWLPKASGTLKHLLEVSAQREEAQRREQLRREREAEEQRLRVLRGIKI